MMHHIRVRPKRSVKKTNQHEEPRLKPTFSPRPTSANQHPFRPRDPSSWQDSARPARPVPARPAGGGGGSAGAVPGYGARPAGRGHGLLLPRPDVLRLRGAAHNDSVGSGLPRGARARHETRKGGGRYSSRRKEGREIDRGLPKSRAAAHTPAPDTITRRSSLSSSLSLSSPRHGTARARRSTPPRTERRRRPGGGAKRGSCPGAPFRSPSVPSVPHPHAA